MQHALVIGAVCLAGLASFPVSTTAQTGSLGLPTAQAALLGRFARGPVALPVSVSAADFDALFGSSAAAAWPAEVQARQFFANGGSALSVVRVGDDGALGDALLGTAEALSGLHALEPLSDLRLLFAPELSSLPVGDFPGVLSAFRAFLEPRRIFLLLDPPPGVNSASDLANWVESAVPLDASFCALYYPYLEVLLDGVTQTVPASGAMAAIYAVNDSATAVWRTPAGTTLPLQAQSLWPALSASDLDLLNAHNIDALRTFVGIGIVPWGGRALDRVNSDNRYVAVVRTRNWAAASLDRALAFAAVQDDAEPLWGQIRNVAGNFLHSMYQQGAFVGSTPATSYFVRCDATTTSAGDIAAHRVNVVYGMALLRSAEFDVSSLSLPTYDSTMPPPTPMLHLASFAGNLMLAYPTIPGFNYILESNPGFEAGTWTEAAPLVIGDGAWRQVSLALGGNQAFYRVQITPAR